MARTVRDHSQHAIRLAAPPRHTAQASRSYLGGTQINCLAAQQGVSAECMGLGIAQCQSVAGNPVPLQVVNYGRQLLADTLQRGDVVR